MKYTYFISVSIVYLSCISQVSAQNFLVTNAPRQFSVNSPTGWIQQPTLTGNSRAKFSSPPRTPNAECAIIVQEYPALSGMSQDEFDIKMAEPVDSNEQALQLKSKYNNVQIISTGASSVSGHPAQRVNSSFSIGTPKGEIWVRSSVVSLATTPGLMWVVTCGTYGRTPVEAQKSFLYWQSEINRFSTFIKIF